MGSRPSGLSVWPARDQGILGATRLLLPWSNEGSGQACGFPLLEQEAKALPTRV